MSPARDTSHDASHDAFNDASNDASNDTSHDTSHDTSRDAIVIDELLTWFDITGIDWPWRRTRDRWHVLVSEVCLQQTQAARAAPTITAILDQFPDAATLAGAPLAELLALWQGLGYPRRARNLHLAAGIIGEQGWPADLTELPGVGAYTAAAISCFADGEPVLPPDINTRRVVARLFPTGAPQPEDHARIVDDAWSWGQAVMELGQRACRARAACTACPVSLHCPSVGTDEVIASPRQARYAGSMRERRGQLLRAIVTDGEAHVSVDAEAARTLVADSLAELSPDGSLLLPPGLG